MSDTGSTTLPQPTQPYKLPFETKQIDSTIPIQAWEATRISGEQDYTPQSSLVEHARQSSHQATTATKLQEQPLMSIAHAVDQRFLSDDYDEAELDHSSMPALSSSHAMMEFNELCQRLGLVPQFKYESYGPYFHGGTLTVGNTHVTSHEPSPLRKETKAQLCRRALSVFAKEGSKAIRKARAERLSSSYAPSPLSSAASSEEGNWVGLLQEHAQRAHRPLPEYSIQSVDNHTLRLQGFAIGDVAFTCTVAVSMQNGTKRMFGSVEEQHNSKAAAKRAAARTAVKWLRLNKLMPGYVTMIIAGSKRPHEEEEQSDGSATQH